MSTFRENNVPKIIYTAPITWKLIRIGKKISQEAVFSIFNAKMVAPGP